MPEEKHCHEICIVLGFATLLAASCAETRREAPEGAVKVGLLIPFSGEQASKGINFERAVTMLADAINDHGGIDGHVLWIETRDTHSDVEVGLRSAADLIENEKVSALIGPDDAELIKRMQPLVESAGISEILPEMVSKTSVTSSDGLWFRIAPSVELMGCALAQEIYNRQLRRVFVIYSKKLEWKAMAAGMSDTFEWYHNGSSEKALTQIVEIDEASTAVTELYSLVSEFRPDTIVMITSPFAGSEIVQGLANFLGKAHWYLGPELDSQVLFDNTPPGALNGSYVVNTEIANQSEGDKFKALFTDAWNDVPFEAAYFYYDALAVLSIAAARAKRNSSSITKENLLVELRNFSNFSGTKINWDEVVDALSVIAKGTSVDYYGLTGPLSFNSDNSIDSSVSIFRLNTIENDKIEFGSNITCIHSNLH